MSVEELGGSLVHNFYYSAKTKKADALGEIAASA